MRRLVLPALVVVLVVVTAGCDRVVDVHVADLDLDRVDLPAQSHLYAADGSEIATLRLAHREPATAGELPDTLVAAVVAAEDRRFFDHGGVDGRAVVRAALANQRAGRVVQGGSTITQQLAKNLYFPEAEETLRRKAAEAHVARRLEAEQAKEEILAAYMDTIYFGHGAYGIVAAARTYFDTEPSELTLEQSALLAGLIRSPEGASPHRDPVAARAARGRVLSAMAETGAISPAEAAVATRAPLDVQPPPPPPETRYPHFVELVKRTLVAEPALGSDEHSRLRRLYGGGLRIHTTIDPRLQTSAEESAERFVADEEGPEVAVVTVRPADGSVLALVGGRDFDDLQFDLATQARREPGSTFKTFALVAALEEGWRLDDEEESGSGRFRLPGGEVWSVRSNSTGPLTLREALAGSANGSFARLGLHLGSDRVAETAENMGIPPRVGTQPSLVLGGVDEGVSPLELAAAYGTLATGGVRAEPRVITRVEDSDGNLLWEPRPEPRIALDGVVAYLTTTALEEVITEGTGRLAALDRPAAGKTGTSQHHRDAWFVGFTPELSTAVWIGHPDGATTVRDGGGAPVEGGGWPARIWRQHMSTALEGTPVRDFPYPAHEERTVEIDPESGGLATEWCPVTEQLTALRAELPDYYCPLHGPPEEETSTPRASGGPDDG